VYGWVSPLSVHIWKRKGSQLCSETSPCFLRDLSIDATFNYYNLNLLWRHKLSLSKQFKGILGQYITSKCYKYTLLQSYFTFNDLETVRQDDSFWLGYRHLKHAISYNNYTICTKYTQKSVLIMAKNDRSTYAAKKLSDQWRIQDFVVGGNITKNCWVEIKNVKKIHILNVIHC